MYNRFAGKIVSAKMSNASLLLKTNKETFLVSGKMSFVVLYVDMNCSSGKHPETPPQ